MDSGHIEEHVIERTEKLAAESDGAVRSCVMDGLKEELKRGITIDVAHKNSLRSTGLSSVSSHRDFVRT